MVTPFQQFVNDELYKRISTDTDLAAMTEGKVPVSTGVGANMTFMDPVELALAAGSFIPLRIIEDAGAAYALDIDPVKRTASFDITLTQPKCNLTFLNAIVTSTYLWTFSITFRQGTGANKVEFPASVMWPYNRPPTLSYDKDSVDIISFVSDPVKLNWRGMIDGGWYNG